MTNPTPTSEVESNSMSSQNGGSKSKQDICNHSWIQDAPIKVCFHCGYKPQSQEVEKIAEKFVNWLFEEYCKEDIDFLDNSHEPKVIKKLSNLLRTASLSATKKERDRILKIIVPGAIGNDGQMYKEIMETQ